MILIIAIFAYAYQYFEQLSESTSSCLPISCFPCIFCTSIIVKAKIYNLDCGVIISKSLSSKSRHSVSHFSSDTPLKKEVNVSSSVLGTETLGDKICSVLHSSPTNYNKPISLNKRLPIEKKKRAFALFSWGSLVYRDLTTNCPRRQPICMNYTA